MKDLKALRTFKNQIKKWLPKDCPCRLCQVYVAQVGFLQKLLRLFASFSGIQYCLFYSLSCFHLFYFIYFFIRFIILFILFMYFYFISFHVFIYFINLFIYLFLIKFNTAITAKRQKNMYVFMCLCCVFVELLCIYVYFDVQYKCVVYVLCNH